MTIMRHQSLRRLMAIILMATSSTILLAQDPGYDPALVEDITSTGSESIPVKYVGKRGTNFFLNSPDDNLQVDIVNYYRKAYQTVFTNKYKTTLAVRYKRKTISKEARIGMVIKQHGKRHSFGSANFSNIRYTKNKVDQPQDHDYYLYNLTGKYNSVYIETDMGVDLEVRAYNNGAAYRYIIKGYEGEYKVLNYEDVYKEDHSYSVLGTFSDTFVMPWHCIDTEGHTIRNLTKQTEPEYNPYQYQQEYADNPDDTILYRSPFINWKDALTIFSVGVNANWNVGGEWRDCGMDWGLTADVVYKHIYAGISFTPCYNILVIHWNHDYHPFENVMGNIDAWTVTGRLGYTLPIQVKSNYFALSPYLATGYMRLVQHEDPIMGYHKPDPRHRNLMGPGIKLQCIHRERFGFGASFEYLYFTSPGSPANRISGALTFGYLF